MTVDSAEVTALALWVAFLTAYLRRLLGPLAGRDRLPGLYGPALAALSGELIALGGWLLGMGPTDWRQAVMLGLQAAIVAAGGYPALKAIAEGKDKDGNGGGNGNGTAPAA
jgi:hypothetical protein